MLSRQVSQPNVTQPYVPRPDMSVASKVEPGLVNSRLDNSVVTPEMPGLLSNGRFQHPQVFHVSFFNTLDFATVKLCLENSLLKEKNQ